jgi:hypothetical protein
MKNKFKIIDTSTGQKLKLREKEMIVMNDQGIFFVVVDMLGYDCHVKRLSDVCPVFEVEWKGEE